MLNCGTQCYIAIEENKVSGKFIKYACPLRILYKQHSFSCNRLDRRVSIFINLSLSSQLTSRHFLVHTLDANRCTDSRASMSFDRCGSQTGMAYSRCGRTCVTYNASCYTLYNLEVYTDSLYTVHILYTAQYQCYTMECLTLCRGEICKLSTLHACSDRQNAALSFI